MDAFTSGQVDAVHLVYNEFKSVLQQRVVVEQLLPIPRAEIEGGEAAAPGTPPVDYLYEPTPEAAVQDAAAHATSRCRSIARCSSRTPRSTPRR